MKIKGYDRDEKSGAILCKSKSALEEYKAKNRSATEINTLKKEKAELAERLDRLEKIVNDVLGQ